jgi:hypothetical protein
MTPASAPAVRRDLEPTHPCIRCGRPGVPAENGLCELCNPLELSQPSATQMHGIAAVGIIAFVALLAVLGRVALAGTGPFDGSVTAVAAAADGLNVKLSVSNKGSNASATTCTLTQAKPTVNAPAAVVQTPRIGAGETLAMTADVPQFGSQPIELLVSCGGSH